jgi:metallo-beta-lactamase family protein
MDGEKEVNIFGETFMVHSAVKTMDYFSGHADQLELIDYLRFNPPEKLKNLFLVHGDEEQANPFREKIISLGYKNVYFPFSGEIIEI